MGIEPAKKKRRRHTSNKMRKKRGRGEKRVTR
jgi:hypothetical protein